MIFGQPDEDQCVEQCAIAWNRANRVRYPYGHRGPLDGDQTARERQLLAWNDCVDQWGQPYR